MRHYTTTVARILTQWECARSFPWVVPAALRFVFPDAALWPREPRQMFLSVGLGDGVWRFRLPALDSSPLPMMMRWWRIHRDRRGSWEEEHEDEDETSTGRPQSVPAWDARCNRCWTNTDILLPLRTLERTEIEVMVEILLGDLKVYWYSRSRRQGGGSHRYSHANVEGRRLPASRARCGSPRGAMDLLVQRKQQVWDEACLDFAGYSPKLNY
jgi:hypothetical protein